MRGFRIELADIETALNQHEAIRETVVTVHQEKRKINPCAYIVANESQAPNVTQLRAYLKERCPNT